MIQSLLKEVLEKRGRTLYWLSKQSGVRYPTIWQLSRNEVGRLSIDALDKICEVLECQPGDLLLRVADKKAGKEKRLHGRRKDR